MIHTIFTVHDSKAEAFITPFFCPNRAIAIRTFATAANDETHDFHRNAADYQLFEIGTYNDKTSKITQHETPEALGLALTFITND